MVAVLYDYWRSSASYRVRIALALKGVAYKSRPVDLAAGDQRLADHVARNPQGLVPVLDIDGLRLTQSLAILAYLDETRPAPPLLPPDAGGRAAVRAVALAVACDIHPLSNLSVLNRVSALAGDAARAEWNTGNIRRGLVAVEGLLADLPVPFCDGPFCYGTAPGLADCCLIPQLYNAARWGVNYADLPRVSAVAAACRSHPAFVAAHPDKARA